MPELDGYKVCSKLKGDAAFCNIPIILLTAVASHVTSTRYSHADGMATEADDYIAKPVDPAQLLSLIDEHCLVHDETEAVSAKAHRTIYSSSVDGRPTPPESSSAPLDIAASIARAGDPEFWAELVKAYLEEAPKQLQEIDRALGVGDGEALVRHAHSLKGASAELLAEGMRELAHEIELAGAAHGFTGVPALLGQLAAEYGRLEECCVAELRKAHAGPGTDGTAAD